MISQLVHKPANCLKLQWTRLLHWKKRQSAGRIHFYAAVHLYVIFVLLVLPVCTSVPFRLLTRKEKKTEKNKIDSNVPRNNWRACFQLKRSGGRPHNMSTFFYSYNNNCPRKNLRYITY